MRFYTELDPAVFVLRLIPGVTAGIFDYLKEHYDALIIEGFGVGGLPDSGNGALLKALSEWSAAGKIAVFSTQVQHEGSDLEIYEVGRQADVGARPDPRSGGSRKAVYRGSQSRCM